MGMLGNTSPHFGPGLAAGVGAATSSIERNRRQDLLDAKPRLITSGDTVHAQSGDMLIDTGIPTMTRAQSESNKRIKAHQAEVAAGKGGRAGSEGVMDRHIQTQIRMGTKEALKIINADPDFAGMSPKERALEADIQTREHWNANNPKYQVPVPARPVRPKEPEPEPTKPGLSEKIGPVLRKAWEGFTTDLGKGYNVITTGKEEGNAPVTAAPGQQPPAAKPAAPAQQPQQAQPQQPQPQPNRIIDDLKSGKVTKEQLIEDARRAAAAGKDQSIINKKLQEAGIDPISIPAPAQRPNVPMSQ
jgi:hypothetical protein